MSAPNRPLRQTNDIRRLLVRIEATLDSMDRHCEIRPGPKGSSPKCRRLTACLDDDLAELHDAVAELRLGVSLSGIRRSLMEQIAQTVDN